MLCFFRLQIFRHFQHTTSRDGSGRRISRLVISISEFQIPVRYQILGQMCQKILCYMPKQINIFFSSGITVSQCHTVDTPGLTSRPGGTVTISLAGGTMIRRTCLHIEEEGMPGRIILTDHICYCCMDVLLSNITILGIPSLVGCPIQQWQIQQAVNDQAVILRSIHGTPGLNELAYGMISGDQLICCFDSCFPAFLASDQLISCHAGRRIQKSHIVMVYFDLVINTI